MKATGALKIFFGGVLLGMLGVTFYASSYENVLAGGRKVIAEPWALATLFDAYFGFLTFYLWVLYKERGLAARAGWLVAILGLGNMAMAAYALWQIKKLPKGAGMAELLAGRSRV